MAKTDTDLFRFLHKSEWPDRTKLIVDEEPAAGILYPQFEEKVIRSAKGQRTRPADVALGYDQRTNEVTVKSGGGTSLWNKSDAMKGAWHTFIIPDGTEIPPSLKVKKGHLNESTGATHYQIEVRTGQIAIDAFKGALDNLARNAVVRAVELAK